MDTTVPASPDAKASVTLTHSIPFEANPDFNEDIDRHGPTKILNFTFRASQILHDLEPEGYRLALQEYRQNQIENFKEVVYDLFPTPIANPFFRAEQGYDHDVQRLHLLRDVWEALICTLYALVVGEGRSLQLPLKDIRVGRNANLRMEHLLSDKISSRLDIMSNIVELAKNHGYDLMCFEMVNDEVVQKLRELNRVRNSFSHSGAISDQQARELFATYHDDVVAILQKVADLSNIVFMRYTGPGRAPLEYRFEEFIGHATTRRYTLRQLSRDQVNICASYLHPQNIIVLHKNRVYSVSPFLHFVLRDQGHQTKLCFYKTERNQDFLYEVVSESQQERFSRTTFTGELQDLASLLQH
jgi:hypothetical protein